MCLDAFEWEFLTGLLKDGDVSSYDGFSYDLKYFSLHLKKL